MMPPIAIIIPIFLLYSRYSEEWFGFALIDTRTGLDPAVHRLRAAVHGLDDVRVLPADAARARGGGARRRLLALPGAAQRWPGRSLHPESCRRPRSRSSSRGRSSSSRRCSRATTPSPLPGRARRDDHGLPGQPVRPGERAHDGVADPARSCSGSSCSATSCAGSRSARSRDERRVAAVGVVGRSLARRCFAGERRLPPPPRAARSRAVRCGPDAGVAPPPGRDSAKSVVLFAHGWTAVDPNDWHRAASTTSAPNGSVVLFPRYQSGRAPTRGQQSVDGFRRGVQTGFEELGLDAASGRRSRLLVRRRARQLLRRQRARVEGAGAAQRLQHLPDDESARRLGRHAPGIGSLRHPRRRPRRGRGHRRRDGLHGLARSGIPPRRRRIASSARAPR